MPLCNIKHCFFRSISLIENVYAIYFTKYLITYLLHRAESFLRS